MLFCTVLCFRSKQNEKLPAVNIVYDDVFADFFISYSDCASIRCLGKCMLGAMYYISFFSHKNMNYKPFVIIPYAQYCINKHYLYLYHSDNRTSIYCLNVFMLIQNKKHLAIWSNYYIIMLHAVTFLIF